MSKSNPIVKEVERDAVVGDFVKITDAVCITTTNGKSDYANGDILKIIALDYYGFPVYGDGLDDNGSTRFLVYPEYVVLENYDPEVEYQDFLSNKASVPFLLSLATDKEILEEQMRRLEARS